MNPVRFQAKVVLPLEQVQEAANKLARSFNIPVFRYETYFPGEESFIATNQDLLEAVDTYQKTAAAETDLVRRVGVWGYIHDPLPASLIRYVKGKFKPGNESTKAMSVVSLVLNEVDMTALQKHLD